MANFKIVGFLIPSHTQRSFKVVIGEKEVGLVNRKALFYAMKKSQMTKVEIVMFIEPSVKPTNFFPEGA